MRPYGTLAQEVYLTSRKVTGRSHPDFCVGYRLRLALHSFNPFYCGRACKVTAFNADGDRNSVNTVRYANINLALVAIGISQEF